VGLPNKELTGFFGVP